MRSMLLGMCLLLLASCGGAAGSSPSLTNTSTATHFKIGQQVKTSGWVVVVKSVQTIAQLPDDPSAPPGATPITAQSGATFLVLDISFQNVSSSSQGINYSQFGLHTSDGTNYQPFATSSPNPATVTAGAATEGEIIYEVPATAKTFTLTFASGRDVTATWDVSA